MNKSKLKATTVQKILKVDDNEIIAHGVTTNSHKTDIFFRNNELAKEIYCFIGKKKEILTTFAAIDFDPDFFFKDIKYFYKNKTNAKLIELFNTFYPGGLKFD